MKVVCDKQKCESRGRYAYCLNEEGRYSYKKCMFYYEPQIKNPLEHNLDDKTLKQMRENER